ncbi:MFS transporter [Microbacterium sp. SSW1-59]|uniref:MFS transporter n=1 Tax=Microbacterium xanthum TaxID=3079794 RepID=UPI002AD4D8F5|nr:MFS transporter [Microbacterium sp. SSW1-59]MDZ8202063.1 MFS transporter [Microbacterium sp. SSW1-59]
MTDSAGRILTRFAPMIYGPTLLFAVGLGAVLPLIPVIAAERGAHLATAALVAAAVVIGQLVGNIPAGYAVARVGERATMVIAGFLGLAGVIGMALTPGLVAFTLSVFVVGLSAAAFGLARHSFMTTRVPLSFRARALSLLGGTFRLGSFTGPFLAAALLAIFGDEHATIWFFAACLVGTILLVLFGPDPETAVSAPDPRRDERDHEDTGETITGPVSAVGARDGVFRTMWRYRAVLSRLGLAAASLSAARAARSVVLPLWGVSIGLDAQTIALVVGVSGAIDFALFYASGQVMDRFGRLWAALPAMILMGSGFAALAVTHEGNQAAMWFAMFAAVLGVGNGLSSGILLTLGADVAPPTDPAPFLGSWRTLSDAGGALAPVLVSAITAVASLPIAVGAMGLIAFAGAGAFLRWVPRFAPRMRD